MTDGLDVSAKKADNTTWMWYTITMMKQKRKKEMILNLRDKQPIWPVWIGLVAGVIWFAVTSAIVLYAYSSNIGG